LREKIFIAFNNTGHIIAYMKAEPLIMRKRVYPDGDIIEIKAWHVSKTLDKPHGFKYSLVYIREGKRVIGYDNAERKGDHRHCEDKEHPYEFKGIDRLIEDFFNDVRRVRHEG
jgi:hypothetical protein